MEPLNTPPLSATPLHNGSPASSFEDNPRMCFGGSWRDCIIDNINRDKLTTNYPPDFRHEHLGLRLVMEIKNLDEKE